MQPWQSMIKDCVSRKNQISQQSNSGFFTADDGFTTIMWLSLVVGITTEDENMGAATIRTPFAQNLL